VLHRLYTKREKEEMAKLLTDQAVRRIKPDPNHRREISDLRARGLHLVIEPSGTKSWSYRYRRPGSGTSANLRMGRVDFGREYDGAPKIGDPLTLASARALATELERQRLRGHDPAAERQIEKRQARIVHAERESNLFPAAVRAFCDGYKIPRKGKPRGWKQTARHLGLLYADDGSEPMMVSKGLAERWRDRLITEITGNDIRIVVDEAHERSIPGMEMRTEGPSDARARKMRDALGGMFGWLMKRGLIVSDPSSGVWRPGPPAPRQRILNCKPDKDGASELRWFWKATDAVGEPYGSALRLLLLTGCRLREIAEMKWSEFSDDLSELRLAGERTKNGKPFTVHLPQLARDIIRAMPKIENCPFVLSSNGRTAGGSWNRVKHRLDAAMLAEARRECGDDATIKPFVLHDLRRTCASGLQQIGVRHEVIERALNHASGSFRGVSGTYQTDPLTNDVRDALTRWAEQIERIVSGESAKVVPIRRA
jgi:integrase